MHIGVSMPTPADPSRIARQAEEHGFYSAWFYDSQMLYADLFVGMALAAKATSRIRLGSGVLVPSNRIAPVTATCLASLNKLAPGRIDFGIGTGATARFTMGQGAVTLKSMAEQIRVIYGLLNNETVEWDSEGKTHKIRYLNPEIGMINLDDPIPLHISALGPKARKLTADHGAGWVTLYTGRERLQEELSNMQQSWTENGRNKADLYSTVFAWCCVLEPGEPADSPRAKAQAGNVVSAFLHLYAEAEATGGQITGPSDGPVREAINKYKRLYDSYTPADAKYLSLHRGHVAYLREDEEHIITADLIRMFTLTGTEDEVVRSVRELADMGINQIALHLSPGQEFDQMARWAGVAQRLGALAEA